LPNVTPERAELLQRLADRYPHGTLLAELKKHGDLPTVSDPVRDVWTNNAYNPPQSAANNTAQPQAPNAPAQMQQGGPGGQAMNDDKGRQDVVQRSKIASRGGKGADSYVDLDSITSSKNMSCEIHEVKLTPMVSVWLPSVDHPE